MSFNFRKGWLANIIPLWLMATIFLRFFPYFMRLGMGETYLFSPHQDLDEISGNPAISQSEHPLPPLTTRQVVHLACVLSCISFIGAWTINASLALTTVASATILSSISGTYVLVPKKLITAICLICIYPSILHTSYWSGISSRNTGISQSRCSNYEASNPLANQ